MKELLFFTILSMSVVMGEQPIPWIFRDSQTIIYVDRRADLEFKVIRNINGRNQLALEVIAKARNTSGIWMEYSVPLPGSEAQFAKSLYLPIDDENNVSFRSREGEVINYKVPLIIFTAYLEGKVDIVWSRWRD